MRLAINGEKQLLSKDWVVVLAEKQKLAREASFLSEN